MAEFGMVFLALVGEGMVQGRKGKLSLRENLAFCGVCLRVPKRGARALPALGIKSVRG
jgi:hypothetical protein